MVHTFFLLATITTLLLLAHTTTTLAQDNIVYDVYSDPLEPDQDYYLVPSSSTDVGGGVKPFPVGSKSCPSTFYVSQEADNLDFGYPIAFSTDSSDIRLSSKLKIYFSDFPPFYVSCYKYFSEWWGISTYNSNYVVELNGDEYYGPFFTIEDDPNGNYNINYCVSPNKCGGLNIINGVNGNPVLGINFTSPMSFVFEPEPLFSKRKIKSALKK